jgi:hypothetical protein
MHENSGEDLFLGLRSALSAHYWLSEGHFLRQIINRTQLNRPQPVSIEQLSIESEDCEL